jgi:DNA polymerase
MKSSTPATSSPSRAPAPVAEKPVAVVTEAKTPPPQPEKPKPNPGLSLPPLSEELENPYGNLAVKTEMRGRVEIIHPAGDTIREKLNNLYRIAKKCDVCRGMGTLRDQLVFAAGNPEADLMFIGESTGEEEEIQKKPFVGPAGKKLDQIILAMGLKREDVYISNIVKYRPKIGDGRFQGPKNRKPTPEEIAASIKFVRSEIEIIRPKVIVALGGTAAEGLLEQSGSVAGLRGRFFDLDEIPVSVTYHPSYILRVEGDSDDELARREKRKVWEDTLAVMEKLEMPISEKQRGFFSK